MEEKDIEQMFDRSLHEKDEEVTKELKEYQNEQDKLHDQLWQHVEEEYGSLVEIKVCMEAWHDRDEQKMRMVCYSYFESLREVGNGWRKLQLEIDLKKNEVMLLKAKQREEERQQAEKRKRDQEAQEAATAKSKPTTAPEAQASAGATSSKEPPRPTRAAPIPQREVQQLDNSLQGKAKGSTKGTIPQTPSKPIL
eukprot:3955519-Amphidinium_carterae.2